MQDLTFSCADFPTGGQTIMARLAVGQGGKGSNQAIACGRTGVRTMFVGAMGPGSYAAEVAAFYRREKIGCRLALKPAHPTGTAVILLNRAGQNLIVIEPGANARLAPVDVPPALLAAAKVVVTQLESSLATTAHVLRAARRAGATTLLNPAPMRNDFDPRLLRHVDILIPNESEFIALVQRLPGIRRRGFNERALHAMTRDSLHALCRKFGVPTLIVTLGSRGCFISEQSGHLSLPAYRGLKVVDTTGAGDAFCGGFAAGLVRHGGGIAEAARLGTAVAALSITKPGAALAMPTQAELRRFLRKTRTA
ncbi:MAG: Ribokinase [Lacunisphaera sp.]|nr:Ribokinase [Lacunisphaera sp.]MDB6165565.1 Ribokinase [Lacunisphaera sp.]